MTDTVKRSPAEDVKKDSQFLRGQMPEELIDGNDHFGKTSEMLLKFHGTYQQDDRDERGGTTEDGKKKKSYIFMVRTRIPGGRLTSDQLLAELDLCDELANATLRITSRQGLQLHGVVKENLKQVIRRINEIQLTTLGACGDVNRNVMCCPAPFKNNIYRTIQNLSLTLAKHFAPRTKAYHELWVTDVATGQKELAGGESEDGFDVEPLYGKHYMPRKFKIGIALPHDNCVDVYTNDLALLAVTQGDEVVGYNLAVGGGQGRTPSAAKTFPALAKRLCYVPADQIVQACEAVFKVQRDYGNREDRKLARLKYLVANWGVEQFKAKTEEYFGGPMADPDPAEVYEFDDHMGWHEQGDGLWFYGLNIENGRIKDTDTMQLKSALREICRTYKPGIQNTAHQSMLFSDIRPEDRAGLEQILRKHHVPLTEEISNVRRWSMACVAWPTCGLSITEAERSLPTMIDQMEAELARLGLSKERFTVRMTGCPNGCARPYNPDVGLVGKARGKYTIFLGGRLLGDRLGFIYKDSVLEAEVVETLIPVFTYYKHARQENETLGDFCHRKGAEDIAQWADSFTANTAKAGAA